MSDHKPECPMLDDQWPKHPLEVCEYCDMISACEERIKGGYEAEIIDAYVKGYDIGNRKAIEELEERYKRELIARGYDSELSYWRGYNDGKSSNHRDNKYTTWQHGGCPEGPGCPGCKRLEESYMIEARAYKTIVENGGV
jgi:hypothetical protein